MHRIPYTLLAALVAAVCSLPSAAQPAGQPGRRGPWQMENRSNLAKPPAAANAAEKKILDVLDEIDRGERFANVSLDDGRFLRQLAEAVGAKRVVELGTSTGDSGLWFAMALRTTGGHLDTHEIDPGRAEVPARTSPRPAWRTWCSVKGKMWGGVDGVEPQASPQGRGLHVAPLGAPFRSDPSHPKILA